MGARDFGKSAARPLGLFAWNSRGACNSGRLLALVRPNPAFVLLRLLFELLSQLKDFSLQLLYEFLEFYYLA